MTLFAVNFDLNFHWNKIPGVYYPEGIYYISSLLNYNTEIDVETIDLSEYQMDSVVDVSIKYPTRNPIKIKYSYNTENKKLTILWISVNDIEKHDSDIVRVSFYSISNDRHKSLCQILDEKDPYS